MCSWRRADRCVQPGRVRCTVASRLGRDRFSTCSENQHPHELRRIVTTKSTFSTHSPIYSIPSRPPPVCSPPASSHNPLLKVFAHIHSLFLGFWFGYTHAIALFNLDAASTRCIHIFCGRILPGSHHRADKWGKQAQTLLLLPVSESLVSSVSPKQFSGQGCSL